MDDADTKLGESLARARLITPTQLKQALEMRSTLGGDLKDILVKMGFVKDAVLSNFLAKQRHTNVVTNLEERPLDENLLTQIPRDILDRHLVVPLKSASENVCLLAMSDPDDFQAIEEIQFLTSRRVEPVVAPKASIKKMLSRFFERPAEAPPAEPVKAEDFQAAVTAIPFEALFRAYIITALEEGRLNRADFLARARRIAGSS